MPSWLRRRRGIIPYLFLLPGGLWLIAFFLVPVLIMASVALQEGSLGEGYRLTFNFGIFPEAVLRWDTQLLRSLLYGLIVTVLSMLIGYPMAYTIAFRGGRYKSILLLLVILPFFTSFIIRTISWRFILADNGIRARHAEGPRLARPELSPAGDAGSPSSAASRTTSCRSWCCRCTSRWRRSTRG